MSIPATDGGPAFLATVWYGGCRNSEADFSGRILAPNETSAAFRHQARVRRLADGSAEAWFFVDTYPAEVEGRWRNVKLDEPKWQRLTHPAIALALLVQAEAQHAEPAESP